MSSPTQQQTNCLFCTLVLTILRFMNAPEFALAAKPRVTTGETSNMHDTFTRLSPFRSAASQRFEFAVVVKLGVTNSTASPNFKLTCTFGTAPISRRNTCEWRLQAIQVCAVVGTCVTQEKSALVICQSATKALRERKIIFFMFGHPSVSG